MAPPRGRPPISPEARLAADERTRQQRLLRMSKFHVIRLTEDVWQRWKRMQAEENLKTQDAVADVLLAFWFENRTAKREERQCTGPRQSSPIYLAEAPGPSFPVSEISESNGGISYNVAEKEATGTCHQEWEVSEEEEDDEEDDDEDDEPYQLDMSLRMNTEDQDVPIAMAADNVFNVEVPENEEEEDDGDIDQIGEEETDRDFVREKKVICFERDLLSLAKLKIPAVCDRKPCRGPVEINTKYIGTAVRISWICPKKHVIMVWDSQPVCQRLRVGDILLSAAIITSGNNFEKISLMFRFFGLGITSTNTHYQLQGKHFCPVIKDIYERTTTKNLQKYAGKEIVVAGDGRMDSLGHSAQYCTYTLMEHNSKDILASIIVDKRMTQLKSTMMEKEGLLRGLQILQENAISIVELVTDASSTIAAMMRKEYPHIIHSFDTWHGAKNFGKKLGGVAAEPTNKNLRPWVPDLINHFWFCSRTSKGDERVLVSKWRGALHHVTNVHQWSLGDGAIVPECEHGELDEADGKWLEAGEAAHTALAKVMLDNILLHSLHHYANFRHTGELETLHEHILMYCAKRFAYSYPVYKARNYLAIIDYEFHKGRPSQINKNGETRLHRCYSKRKATYSVYEVKVGKSYAYMPDMLQEILQNVMDRATPLRNPAELSFSDPRRLKRTLSGFSPPPTKSLMETKKSRFEGNSQ